MTVTIEELNQKIAEIMKIRDELVAQKEKEIVPTVTTVPTPPSGGTGAMKPKRGRKKKVEDAAIVDKTPALNKVSVNTYLDIFAKDNFDRQIREGGGAIRGNFKEIDFSGVCEEEKKVTEQLSKAQKSKTPPRQSVEFVTKSCPVCGDKVEIIESSISMFCWNSQDHSSPAPLFRCEKCLNR